MASEDAPPRRGLLVDFGGVLTTNVFGSFEAFCRDEGLEPDAVAQRFRGDPDARQLLFDLEVGKLTEEEFEPRFAFQVATLGSERKFFCRVECRKSGLGTSAFKVRRARRTVPDPASSATATTTIRTETPTASAAMVRRRRWRGCWLHLRPPGGAAADAGSPDPGCSAEARSSI